QAAEAELGALWQQLAEEYPTFATHRRAEPIDFAEAVVLLGGDEPANLVEFFVGDQAIYVLRITDGQLDYHTVLSRDVEYGDVVTLLRDSMPDGLDRLLALPASQELVRAVDVAKGNGLLYVVPHGLLHLAPLHLDATVEARPRTVLLPSASLLRSTLT